MSYPDFLCIGAQKAGTGWLAANLKYHPGVFIPKLKELHYFNQKMEGLSPALPQRLFGRNNVRWRHFWKVVYKRYRDYGGMESLVQDYIRLLRKPSDHWYSSYFTPQDGQISGELTPEYAYLDEEALTHVYSLMPNVKIIYLLRNPIDRAWSAALMWFRIWKRPYHSVSHQEFIHFFEGSMQKPHGQYIENIERWSQFVPETRIFIGFMDEIQKRPKNFLRRILRFLGLCDHDAVIGSKCNAVIHGGPGIPMPPEIRSHLTCMYLSELERLHERFGGWTTKWFTDAAAVAA